MKGLAVRTTDSPNHTRPSPTWEHFSIGWRRPNHQFLVNCAIWQKVLWNSGGQWSPWSPLQRWKFLQPLCPPIGWRWAHPGWWNLSHKTPITAAATQQTQGGPSQWPVAKTDPLPLRRQMHLLLLPRRRCLCSPTTSPHALLLGFGNCTSPVGGGISGDWSNIGHQHPTWRSQGTKWGDGILWNGDLAVLAPQLRGDVHQYADLHTKYSGPGVQPHGGWLPSPSSVGAPQLGLILHSTAWHSLAHPYTGQFIYPTCLPWCFNRPFFTAPLYSTVDYFILGS